MLGGKRDTNTAQNSQPRRGKCPTQRGLGMCQSPRLSQQIGLSPVGHGQVLAAMPAGFGTSPGTGAKAGAPSGRVPSLLLANHSKGVGAVTWPGLPAAVSLGRAPLAITGTLGRKSILGCFPAEHRIKIPAPCSSSGGTEMREHTAQSFKDVCVSSSAACAMQGGHKTPGKPGLHGKQYPKLTP